MSRRRQTQFRKARFRKDSAGRGRAVLAQLLRGGMVVAIVALAVGLAWGAQALYRQLDAPVQVIAIEGKFERISRPELQALVAPLVTGGTVSLDLNVVRDELQRHPWISEAQVSRRWPDGVAIFVTEETPIARWNDRGFLNSRGELMEIKNNSRLVNLPQLFGPDGAEQEVMTRYRKVVELIQPHGMGIAVMATDARGALEVQLQSGLALRLGKDNALEKIRRMLVAWNAGLAARREQIKALDLRYANGLAVSWQEGRGGSALRSGQGRNL